MIGMGGEEGAESGDGVGTLARAMERIGVREARLGVIRPKRRGAREKAFRFRRPLARQHQHAAKIEHARLRGLACQHRAIGFVGRLESRRLVMREAGGQKVEDVGFGGRILGHFGPARFSPRFYRAEVKDR